LSQKQERGGERLGLPGWTSRRRRVPSSTRASFSSVAQKR
jgi:hypothetical protein